MSAGTARLFVGSALPADVAEVVHARFAAPFRHAGWRVLQASELHLTYLFLGAVPVERIGELAAALDRELAGAAALPLVLEATGAFPAPERPRVAWLGGPGLSAATFPLHVRCHAVAERLGLAREPRSEPAAWTAHVTLARPPRGRRARLPPGFLAARLEHRGVLAEVALFETRPPAAGQGRYVGLHRVPLISPTA